jgi:hypothetical protein
MSSRRRRSARLSPARFRLGSNVEALESRQLLTQSPYLPLKDYALYNNPPALNPGSVPVGPVNHPIGSNPALVATYSNEGKEITGEDRQGNRYDLRLTGPGEIIVTDTSPNDGALDDNINTITLVGTSLTKSVLTGTVQQSYNSPSSPEALQNLGTVYFNALVADSGVKTIVLNGFVLTDTITPPGSATLSPLESAMNQTTGINLLGGVGTLDFEGIDGRFPTPNTANSINTTLNPSMTSDPIEINIGNTTTPLTVEPNIRIDHIDNTVYDSNVYSTDPTTGEINSTTIPTGALTTPTIDLIVNGAIKNFDVVSVGETGDLMSLTPDANQAVLDVPTKYIPTANAALEYYYPTVGSTGRTAVQTTAIKNVTATGSLTIGGQTDAVAIDSNGSIKLLEFEKGLGNPTGDSSNPIYYGTPTSADGYAALGQEGAQIVTEGTIGQLIVGPNGQFTQTSQNPALITSGLAETTVTVNQPGSAVTESLVAAGGSIGKIHIIGDLTNSEIKAGYNYYAAIGGADGVSGSSTVGPLTLRGNLVDSVISASYRPVNGHYGDGSNEAGNGTITGVRSGQVVTTSTGSTVLGNTGSGLFAKKVKVAVHPKGSNQQS